MRQRENCKVSGKAFAKPFVWYYLLNKPINSVRCGRFEVCNLQNLLVVCNDGIHCFVSIVRPLSALNHRLSIRSCWHLWRWPFLSISNAPQVSFAEEFVKNTKNKCDDTIKSNRSADRFLSTKTKRQSTYNGNPFCGSPILQFGILEFCIFDIYEPLVDVCAMQNNALECRTFYTAHS